MRRLLLRLYHCASVYVLCRYDAPWCCRWQYNIGTCGQCERELDSRLNGTDIFYYYLIFATIYFDIWRTKADWKFDRKLIPEFDGSASGPPVVEWVEKLKLIFRLCWMKRIVKMIPLRLTAVGAFERWQVDNYLYSVCCGFVHSVCAVPYCLFYVCCQQRYIGHRREDQYA